METVGKILSLTLFAIFGAAGTVIYFTDHNPHTPIISISRNQEVQSESNIDYSAYRKKLRKSYVQSETPIKTTLESPEAKSLWTNSYHYPSETAKRLAEANSLAELRDKMNFWNSQYHKALQSGNTQQANEAYIKYKDYKEALDIKGVF
ncbi:MAG TPA: hypothetical protein VNN20_01950 [Thermodesulfobacteriota bacterium]|nr:hypothetical protein [Thermodesulfobacteriota bacterium]